MSTKTTENHSEDGKKLNRPMVFIKQGVTGEMLYGKKEKPGAHFSPLSEKATIAKSKALELFESGISISEVAKKLRKSRTTINTYFNNFAKEKGDEWVEKVRQKKQ